MERLTSVNQNFELQFCSEVPCPFYGEPNGCNNPNYTCPSFCYFTSTAEKLAEYEDTGLIPDEIKELQADNAELKARLKQLEYGQNLQGGVIEQLEKSNQDLSDRVVRSEGLMESIELKDIANLEDELILSDEVPNHASVPMHYVYTNKNTGEKYRLGDLQDKYELGFADSRLWKIIEHEYEAEIRPQREWREKHNL